MIDPGAPLGDGASESLAPYLAVLKRRRRVLVLIPLIFALAVGAGLWLLPQQYMAEASFISQDPQSGSAGKVGSITGIASQLGISGVGGLAGSLSGATGPDFYAALLDSKELLHSVVVTQYPATPPDGFSGDLVVYFKLHKPTRTESEIEAIKRFRKRIMRIAVDPKAAIVSVTISTTDAGLSQNIAKRMLSLVNDFNLQRRQSQAGAERAFAERRSQEALADLDRAEQTLTAFDERNRSLFSSPRLQTERMGLTRRIEIASQVYLTMVQQYEQARVDAVRNTPLISVIDSPDGLVEPVQKQIPVKMVLAAIGALVAVILWALATEPALRRPEAVEFSDVSGRQERPRTLAAD